MKKELAKIYRELNRHGLLMLSDPELPSLVTLIAGGPVKGSWWGHPQGNLMYNLSQQLEDDPEILVVKLVNRKVTYLHQRHWNALVSIAMEKSAWQMKGLTTEHKGLLSAVQKKGALQVDEVGLKKTPAEIGKLATKLEERLLLTAESRHTDSGKHLRLLKSWQFFTKESPMPLGQMESAKAIQYFNQLFTEWTSGNPAKLKAPWEHR